MVACGQKLKLANARGWRYLSNCYSDKVDQVALCGLTVLLMSNWFFKKSCPCPQATTYSSFTKATLQRIQIICSGFQLSCYLYLMKVLWMLLCTYKKINMILCDCTTFCRHVGSSQLYLKKEQFLRCLSCVLQLMEGLTCWLLVPYSYCLKTEINTLRV